MSDTSPVFAWNRALTANSTAASFTAPTAVIVAPTPALPGTGTFTLFANNDSRGANNLRILPVGVGADGTTFSLRVYGLAADTRGTWHPVLLAQFSCTLAGTATPYVLNNVSGYISGDRYCDDITITYGLAGINVSVIVATAEVPAHILLDAGGYNVHRVEFDMTGATSGNAIVAAV